MTSFSPPRPDQSAASAAARVAVLLPCYNEAAAIGQTVAAFRAALPDAAIYVYDNNSSDGTAAVAAAAGATVRIERMQGKGHVVRRMFADIDADIYVLADGDATYDAGAAPAMIARLADERLDMVVGARQSEVQAAYRRGHRLGNRLLTGCVAWIFGRSFSDILSGYRVFSRRFVKSFPVLAQGFEIETDITVHALELRLPVAEVMTAYAARPEGSASKLSTWRDGWRILTMILNLARTEKPVTFFGLFAALFLATALGLSVDLVATYLDTGLVPRLPTAVLAMGLTLVALLALVCGLILDTVTRGRREIKRLAYLAQPAPGTPSGSAP
jgi:glycosyltransferase involved in cell wall biosynthesis